MKKITEKQPPDHSKSKTQREPPALTCEQLEGFVVDYLDHKLPGVQHDEFVQHLNHCPPCEQYIKNYQETIKLTQAAFDDERNCVNTMPEALVQAILASQQKRS